MFCTDLKNQAMKIVNYEKKEKIPLTDEESESSEKQKVCYIREKEFSTDKKTIKPEIIVITQNNLEMILIVFVI